VNNNNVIFFYTIAHSKRRPEGSGVFECGMATGYFATDKPTFVIFCNPASLDYDI